MTSTLLISRTGLAPSGRGPAGRAPDSSTFCANGLVLDPARFGDLLDDTAVDLEQRVRLRLRVVLVGEGDRVGDARLEVLVLLESRLDVGAADVAVRLVLDGVGDPFGHRRHRVPTLDVVE